MTSVLRCSSRVEAFLEASPWIDFLEPGVQRVAEVLRQEHPNVLELAGACFHYVRDEISHCCDAGNETMTCRASEVLQHRTGFCYAKSHLLAALLRANGIPTALCYQRLRYDEDGTAYCLHGLNAIHLPKYGWYRVDPRGDKEGVATAFSPPEEQLAFPVNGDDEFDIPELWASPRPEVVAVLETIPTVSETVTCLPDETRPRSSIRGGASANDYRLRVTQGGVCD